MNQSELFINMKNRMKDIHNQNKALDRKIESAMFSHAKDIYNQNKVLDKKIDHAMFEYVKEIHKALHSQ